MTRRGVTIVVVAVIVVLAIAGLSQTLWRPFSTNMTAPYGTVAAIDVREAVSGLTVTAGDRTEVRQIATSWLPGSSSEVTLSGTTLTLNGCGWWCRVRYEVTVAAGVDLTGRLGSGDLTAHSPGAVTFSTGSGSIRLTESGGPVAVETGTGDIRIEGAAGSVRASTGSGNVTVVDPAGTVDAATGSGNIDLTMAVPMSAALRAGSGNITARVPAGPYRIAGTTGSGNRAISVSTDPASTFVLTLDTGSGNVNVQPR